MEIKEMIAVLQAFEEGKEIEYKEIKYDNYKWLSLTNGHRFNFINNRYRIKPQLTCEEITAAWVKDNNIVVGSKVRVVGETIFGYDMIGKIVKVTDTDTDGFGVGKCITVSGGYILQIESLEPYKEEFVPFTENDFELFCDKWVMFKNNNTSKFKVIHFDNKFIGLKNYQATYESAFENYVFIDGTPFGKLS